ncbi:MAG: hypothetical protein ACPGLV_03570 [Bacteroidia bacterium]
MDNEPQSKNDFGKRLSSSTYNSELADSLGADALGMKLYTFCYLKAGKEKIMTEEEFLKTEQGHLEYVNFLAKKKHIVLTGAFVEKTEYLGFMIFTTDSLEAKSLLQKDPKIQSDIIYPEFTTWYGPASLHELYPIHKTLIKQ